MAAPHNTECHFRDPATELQQSAWTLQAHGLFGARALLEAWTGLSSRGWQITG